MKLLDEGGRIDGDRLRPELADIMLSKCNYQCPMYFYSFRRNKTSTVIYSNCRYPSHVQWFRYAITDESSVTCNLYISSTKCEEIVHEGPPIFCTLRGRERVEVQQKLEHTTPRLYQLEVNKTVDKEIAADGHYQKARKLATYQVAKSEIKRKNDVALRSGDLSDLFQKHILSMTLSDPYGKFV